MSILTERVQTALADLNMCICFIVSISVLSFLWHLTTFDHNLRPPRVPWKGAGIAQCLVFLAFH